MYDTSVARVPADNKVGRTIDTDAGRTSGWHGPMRRAARELSLLRMSRAAGFD
jgi:hypothetical protein